MKKKLWVPILAMLGTMTAGAAMATTYTYSVNNRLNAVIGSNNEDAVCSVRIALRTGAGVMASNDIQLLKAGEERRVTLNAKICNLVQIVSDCRFRDYQGNVKQETKALMQNCAGGEIYLNTSPFGSQWNTYSLSFFPER